MSLLCLLHQAFCQISLIIEFQCRVRHEFLRASTVGWCNICAKPHYDMSEAFKILIFFRSLSLNVSFRFHKHERKSNLVYLGRWKGKRQTINNFDILILTRFSRAISGTFGIITTARHKFSRSKRLRASQLNFSSTYINSTRTSSTP